MSRRPSASFALSFAHASVAAVLAFGAGCSSSTSTPGPTGDSGTGAGDTATVDTGSAPKDTAPVDTAPGACWVIAPSDPALAKCQACSEDKCKAKWDAAWGAAFVSSGGSSTGGACGDTGKCLCGCSEVDAICKEACDVAQNDACRTARRAIYDCEGTSCATECGRAGL